MKFLRHLWLPLICVVLLGALVVGWRFKARVDVGVGFAAHQLCSCVFIAERPLEQCREDVIPGTKALKAEVLSGGDEGRVRAWVNGLGVRTAVYTGRTGCILQ